MTGSRANEQASLIPAVPVIASQPSDGDDAMTMIRAQHRRGQLVRRRLLEAHRRREVRGRGHERAVRLPGRHARRPRRRHATGRVQRSGSGGDPPGSSDDPPSVALVVEIPATTVVGASHVVEVRP
jgi:hypothetical protein